MKLHVKPVFAALLLCLAMVAAGCRDADPRNVATTDRQQSDRHESDRQESTQEPLGGGDMATITFGIADLNATAFTFTNWEAIRDRLGYPDLSSESLMTDRLAFADEASQQAVLLTDGALVEDNSTYELDFGFTTDDVEWESHWAGGAGPGFALKLRDDLDLDGVERAVDRGVGVLDGASLDEDRHLITKGVADRDGWIQIHPEVDPDLWAGEFETGYLHTGCIPFDEAFGPDATIEDQEAITAKHDIAGLGTIESLGITFTGDQATGWTMPSVQADQWQQRVDLIHDWPTTDILDLDTAFGAARVDGDQVRLPVKQPRAAALIALADVLPYGVCDQVQLLPEPTGL